MLVLSQQPFASFLSSCIFFPLHSYFIFFLPNLGLGSASSWQAASHLQQWHCVWAIAVWQTSPAWNHFFWPGPVSSAHSEKWLRTKQPQRGGGLGIKSKETRGVVLERGTIVTKHIHLWLSSVNSSENLLRKYPSTDWQPFHPFKKNRQSMSFLIGLYSLKFPK